MTLDIGKFDNNKQYIVDWYKEKGGNDVSRSISVLAGALGVPCIACAIWIGEATDWHPDTIKSIKSLVSFYGYTKIENYPPNMPKEYRVWEKEII